MEKIEAQFCTAVFTSWFLRWWYAVDDSDLLHLRGWQAKLYCRSACTHSSSSYSTVVSLLLYLLPRKREFFSWHRLFGSRPFSILRATAHVLYSTSYEFAFNFTVIDPVLHYTPVSALRNTEIRSSGLRLVQNLRNNPTLKFSKIVRNLFRAPSRIIRKFLRQIGTRMVSSNANFSCFRCRKSKIFLAN